MASSIRAGVKAVQAEAPTAEGVLLLTCDQPRVSAEHLGRLIQMSYAQSAPTAIASAYGGIRGIPAIFPDRLFMICSLFAATKVRVHCLHTHPGLLLQFRLTAEKSISIGPKILPMPG